MKHRWMVSAALACMAGSPGWAQATNDGTANAQSPAQQNAPEGGAPNSAQPQVEPGTGSEGIQDIIVTAQRVKETAQRAPLAISVVQPAELVRQGITRPEDLQRSVPALAGSNAGGANTVFFIRGVGNFTVNAYSDSAIAFNYDGVYIGRPSSTGGTFYDLQRIEVLKGPQGTLYGRNATGGAINVIPNRPKVGETSLDFSASYGNYNAVLGQAALNLPIGDRGAFRLSGTYADHDGYNNDGTGDQHEYGARAQIYADLTPSLNIRLSADYSHQGGNGTGATYLGLVSPSFGATGFSGYSFTPAGFGPKEGLHSPASKAYQASQFAPQAGRTGEVVQGYPYNNNGYWGVLAEINATIGGGTLTVVPAYREADVNNLFTQAGMNGAETNEHDQQASIEARYAGKFGDVLDYLIGGYYFKEDIHSNVYFSQYILTPFQDFTTATESYAGFGKITAHIGSKLGLTVAGRYSKDNKTFNGTSDTYLLFCGNPAPPQDFCPTLPFEPLVNNAAQLRAFYAAQGIRVVNVPLYALPPFLGGSQTAPFILNAQIPINAQLKSDKFTYRFAAEYQLNPTSLLYASYETGYHSGGFAFARGLESYRPETIRAWTVGSKNRFLDRRVQLNLEGYYWKYRDQQYSQFGYDLGSPPATVFLTRNIGRSTIYGFEGDLQVLATRNTLISAAVQYLHTKYDSFVYLNPNTGLPPITSCPYAAVSQVVNGQTLSLFQVNCSGKPAFNSPKWSFNVNGQQTVPIGDHKLILQAGTRYRSRAEVDANYSPFIHAKANFVSNASVTLAPMDERWFVTGFVNNLANARRLNFDAQNQSLSVFVGTYEPPRTFGLRVGGRFR